MDGYLVVLNAGSSSLKFCIYGTAAGDRLAARSPRADRRHRHVAPVLGQGRNAAAPVGEQRVDRDGARRGLGARIRRRRGSGRGIRRAQLIGVGHRVVHGGVALHGAGAS